MAEYCDFIVDGTRYAIHDGGAVWSYRSGRFLKPDIDKDGYAVFRLGHFARARKAHELVLTYFDRPRQPGEQTRHLDGNPSNNWRSNLLWGTGTQNWADKRRHGTAAILERHGHAKLTRDDVAVIRAAPKSYGYAKHLAGRFGVSTSLIRKVRSGEAWQFG